MTDTNEETEDAILALVLKHLADPRWRDQFRIVLHVHVGEQSGSDLNPDEVAAFNKIIGRLNTLAADPSTPPPPPNL